MSLFEGGKTKALLTDGPTDGRTHAWSQLKNDVETDAYVERNKIFDKKGNNCRNRHLVSATRNMNKHGLANLKGKLPDYQCHALRQRCRKEKEEKKKK